MVAMYRLGSLLFASSFVAGGVAAFHHQSRAIPLVSSPHRIDLGAVLRDMEPDPVSSSEQSRKFRRDFYTHDIWLKARAKNRFIGTMSKIFDSVVVRQLVDECLLLGAIATSVALWNALLVTGYDDFDMVHHAPLIHFTVPLIRLPGEPFSLSSPALSLLLGKTSHERIFYELYSDCSSLKCSRRTRLTGAGMKPAKHGE